MSIGKPTTTRRSFLTQAAGAALATTLPASAQTAATPKPVAKSQSATIHNRKRPLNVLFFMSDDMRPELACYSSRFNAHSPTSTPSPRTAFASTATTASFRSAIPRARRSSPATHPARDRHPRQHRRRPSRRTPTASTLPHHFRQNGYTALRTGKIFHGGLDDPQAWNDFDGDAKSIGAVALGKKMEIPPERIPMPDGTLPPLPKDSAKGEHSDEIIVLEGNGEGGGDYRIADRAIKMLNQVAADPDKPFFIGCGFTKPHSPPTAPQRFFDLRDPAKIQLPPDFAAWPTVPPGFPKAAIRPKNADLFIGRGASSPKPARSSAPTSPRSPGPTGTLAASSPNWNG